ncbi:MAG: hypothetical protein KOO62_13470 [candidate division Zixibacteria bacterium]|nr:hypothetical protein [candidate division Zixibacteria bacterium]
MKTKLLTILLIFIVALPLVAAPPYKSRTEPSLAAVVDNATYINANKILMFVTNHANFCRDLSGVFGHDAGTFYPYVDNASIDDGSLDDYILYASGLWVGGLVNSEIRVAVAEYSDEYVPGPMDQFVSVSGDDTTWTFNPGFGTDPAYKVYKLYSDSMTDNPNADWTNWPAGDGAPVNDQDEPDMIGDQMLWAVYNDANPDAHDNGSGETDPLGIEIRQTTWAFDREDALGEIIFIRFQVFNKGGNTIEDCHFSLWCDPDLGEYTDDLVGCFVDESMGYVYNSDNDDANHYGATPPAVGYDFFQGPLMFTGDDNDVAKMWGTTWPGYVNMGMTSFNKYINGTDPNDFNETFNYMRGLDANGDPYEYDGVVTKYMHAGDPTAGTGDIDYDPADRRWMQTTGPITFEPGDSTEFVAAIVVGRAIDRLTSISLMKFNDRFAQIAYDADFVLPSPPASPIVNASFKNEGVSLSWTDTCETDHGTYPFEGYIIWQGATSTGPWTQVAAFDLVNSIVNVFDEVFDPVTAVPEIRLVKNGGDLGVKHHIFIEQDHVLGGPLRNITKYHYKVEAYTVDQSQDWGFKTLTSATTVSVIPQRPVADEEYSVFFGDTLAYDHSAGTADGFIVPLVIDHYALTGHAYKVGIQVIDGTTYWHLIDTDLNDTVLIDQTNISGDDDYVIVDGMLVKTSGPAPGVKPGDMFASDDETTWGWDIPNGTRRFTWGNADGFGWEGFRGALGWGGPGDGNGFGTADPIPPENLPNVLLKLAPVAADGTFDPSHENVSYAYRYLRGPGPPAQPEFEPYIVDPDPPGGSYGFQDFEKSMPLSAWNMDIDPPQRLAVGYLENNAVNGLVDGQYWPGMHTEYDNVAGDGPREWLWIYLDEYQETPKAEYQLNAIDDPMPVMYWATWNRHGTSGTVFEDGDEFAIYPNRVLTAADEFTFDTDIITASTAEDVLDNITVSPNPFYLYGPYDPAIGNYQIMFQNLPTECIITIYNLAGEFVYEIDKDDPTTSTASWGANTANGLPVASGIYLWVVDAPDIGQKVGKIAVFTEVELLQTY